MWPTVGWSRSGGWCWFTWTWRWAGKMARCFLTFRTFFVFLVFDVAYVGIWRFCVYLCKYEQVFNTKAKLRIFYELACMWIELLSTNHATRPVTNIFISHVLYKCYLFRVHKAKMLMTERLEDVDRRYTAFVDWETK